ncbi:type IV pilus twitching motility protein PilT [Lachnobacterium bovis]|jgi:twitching motility protein PilT|uniref:Twitching motility protein PilT n=1 Tax=Lachnobacterium bovis DSM 14045 TaxID=1122142 RepID=A0A1H3GQU0_9FIRM|nr:PilT/PilU family type 4a pilus ATPase [Lachnobacterium bovis]MBQ1802314.1 PilT/PilU family type 4a pilus ATPase [Lachnobacterium sp.]SDY05325.1 twitching motility protein PilT [Lachnobacterium bovis DSM 14045]
MNVIDVLKNATKQGASDIFIITGRPLTYRINENMILLDDKKLIPDQTKELVSQIYELTTDNDITHLLEHGDDDFSFAIPGVSRFRVCTFKQRGSLSAVIRVITFDLPNPSDIGIPETVMNLANLKNGLVLVTGLAGSGKSTTLACIIDKINKEQEKHIITLEDPIEYLHRHEKSIVTQREINTDSQSYLTALRASLRQSPDVILLGEMRDYETMNVAVTAAETGHLIFSTLHTIGASHTIDRITDAFPATQQHQIAIQLSSVLKAVVSQKLIPSIDGKIIPAFEIMFVNPAIRTLIREEKNHQLEGIIYTASSQNMVTMDSSIYKLYVDGIISKHTAVAYANHPDRMIKKINGTTI